MRFLQFDPLTRSVNSAPRLMRRDFWLMALLTAIALTLRFIGLNEGLWYDEIETLVNYVPLPVLEIMARNDSRNNHVLYSVLAHFTTSWLGESAWAVRLPAALLGAATIPAAYYLGMQLATRREALLAAAFLTVSYHHVWFSQSARAYSGLLLATVLLSILFVRLLQTRTPSWTLVLSYAVVAALGTLFHLTCAFVVAAHGLIWLLVSVQAWRKGSSPINWRAAIPIFGGGALYAVFNARAFTQVIGDIIIYAGKLPPGPFQTASNRIDRGAWFAVEFVQGLGNALPGGMVFVPLLFLAALFGFWSYLRQGLLSWGVLMIPLLLTVGVLEAVGEHIFPRFIFPFTVSMIMVGVRGGYVIAHKLIPPLSMNQITAVGLAAAMATSLMVPRAWQPKQDVLGAYAYLQENIQPGDAVVCVGPAQVLMRKYAGLKCLSVNNVEELDRVEAGHTRTWLVYTLVMFFSRNRSTLWHTVQAEYQLMKTTSSTVNNGEIVIMLKSVDPSGG